MLFKCKRSYRKAFILLASIEGNLTFCISPKECFYDYNKMSNIQDSDAIRFQFFPLIQRSTRPGIKKTLIIYSTFYKREAALMDFIHPSTSAGALSRMVDCPMDADNLLEL